MRDKRESWAHSLPTLLVVDDDVDLRRLLRVRLKRHFSVYEAATAKAALDMAGTRDYDAILLDVDLPGVDGLCCLELLLLAHPFLPVFLMSARDASGLPI